MFSKVFNDMTILIEKFRINTVRNKSICATYRHVCVSLYMCYVLDRYKVLNINSRKIRREKSIHFEKK